jgi:hypothetical protein
MASLSTLFLGGSNCAAYVSGTQWRHSDVPKLNKVWATVEAEVGTIPTCNKQNGTFVLHDQVYLVLAAHHVPWLSRTPIMSMPMAVLSTMFVGISSISVKSFMPVTQVRNDLILLFSIPDLRQLPTPGQVPSPALGPNATGNYIGSGVKPLPLCSKLFTGQGDYLGNLQQYFCRRDVPSPRRCFLLYGMGGAGKTQICLKFVGENSEL